MKKLLNSATSMAAQERIDNATAIMKMANLSREQWTSVLFDLGCGFIEKWVQPSYMQKQLLQNKELGFWDWWMVQFMDDDKMLLSGNVDSYSRYRRTKRYLLDVPELYTQFEYFLNRNKIQEAYEQV